MLCVKIDGKVQDVHYMESKSYKNYYSPLRVSKGEHLLTLEYMNDAKNGGSAEEDRNIWISRIEIVEPLDGTPNP